MLGHESCPIESKLHDKIQKLHDRVFNVIEFRPTSTHFPVSESSTVETMQTAEATEAEAEETTQPAETAAATQEKSPTAPRRHTPIRTCKQSSSSSSSLTTTKKKKRDRSKIRSDFKLHRHVWSGGIHNRRVPTIALLKSLPGIFLCFVVYVLLCSNVIVFLVLTLKKCMCVYSLRQTRQTHGLVFKKRKP